MLDRIAIMFVSYHTVVQNYTISAVAGLLLMIMLCLNQEVGVAKVKELDKLVDPCAEPFMRAVLQEFCKDARYRKTLFDLMINTVPPYDL